MWELWCGLGNWKKVLIYLWAILAIFICILSACAGTGFWGNLFLAAFLNLLLLIPFAFFWVLIDVCIRLFKKVCKRDSHFSETNFTSPQNSDAFDHTNDTIQKEQSSHEAKKISWEEEEHRLAEERERRIAEAREQRRLEEARRLQEEEREEKEEFKRFIRERNNSNRIKQMRMQRYNKAYMVNLNDITTIDGMDGYVFERFCADLLQDYGYIHVTVTPPSGDHGVDIIAEKDGIRFAVQCKNYASPLSNTPIQEVNTGKVMYKCHVGVVMTNSTFTPSAKALAEAAGVVLWDRTVLHKMIASLR